MSKLRMPKLKGVIPAMITPFTAKGEIDDEAAGKLIDHFIKSGVHGIMCCGSTGEAAALSREERRHVVELTVQSVKGRVPVIAGTGTSGTKLATQLTQDAKEVGADAALVVTPFNLIPTEEGICEHYKTIATQVDMPILVYNVPQATMVNVTPPLIARLVKEIDTMVGVKESSGSISQIAETIRLAGDEIAVLTGNDAGLYPDFLLGCPGAIVAIANIAPRMAIEIYESLQKGELKMAKTVYYELLPVAVALGGEQNWSARVKEMVRLQGLPAGHVRKPYTSLAPDEIEPLTKALKSARLI